MGLLGQAWLLLWKNIKLRQRRPILTLAQIIWPLLIFAVIAILRTSFPAKDAAECQYNARAVPSSGVLPFMQSMVCDLESSCVRDTVPSNEVPTLADAQIGQMLQDLDPVFQNDTLIDTIKALPETLAPITEFVEVVGDTVKNLTDIQPRVADLFHNVTQLRNALQDIGIPEEAVDAIFNATVDILEILNLVGSTNIGQVCNETGLQQLLIFPPNTDVAKVSAALCKLTSDEVSTIVDQLLEELDILYISNEIEQFLEAVEPYGLDKFMEDVEEIRDQLKNSGDLGGLFERLPQLIQLTKIAPAIEFIIEEISKDPTQQLIEELVSVIERIDGYLENIHWWQKLKQIVNYALEVIDTIKNTAGEDRDRGITLVSLIQNSTRLIERLNITGDILEILMETEIRIDQIPLFLDLLENPEKAAAMICSGNISQVITLPPDVDPDAAAMFLCSFNITEVFEIFKDEVDLATLLDEFAKLLDQDSNDQTLDWEDVLNRTFSLIDEFNQIGEMPLSEVVTDFLDTFANFTNLDTSTLEYWLGLFISGNATSGSAKNESGLILDAWLEPLVTLLQAELAQTPLWLHIQKQLIIQSLGLDLQLQLLDTFASGSCPDNWHSHTPSCYQYSHDKVDFETSLEVCLSLHSFAHPVVVNHQKEQEFLQTIGEDEPSWLGLYIQGGNRFWLNGEEVIYTNWENLEVTSECVVAEFGRDGLWYPESCTSTASNLCEAPQEHALVTLIKDSPMSDLSEIMLKIGPNATEILLQEIFKPSAIEMLLSKDTNVTFELCSESFLDAVGYDLPDDILTQICAWDLDAFWESQMEYGKFPEIEQKISELVEISLTEPDEIPESYYPLADFEAIISKQNMLTEMITAVSMIPLNLESLLTSLQPNIEVTGTPEEWQAVAERLNNYWYQQQLQQLIDQLVHLGNSTGLLEKFTYDFQQQLAIQEVANLIVQAGNTLFQIIEDLSKGIIGVNEPETQKLLIGIKKLLESSAQIQAAIGEAVENPEKASRFFNAMMQENFFCNATLRDSVLDLKVEERQIFDDYICAVDYPVFFMELVVLLDVPEIEKLIRFYIPYNTSVDLLPFPDPVESQEIWAEYVNYLININEIRSQYIETYNLTKMEVIFPVPDFSNLSSSVNFLDILEKSLNAYDIDFEALKFVQSVIEDLLTPGGYKDPSLEDILQELNPLLNSSGINLKDLEELVSVIDYLLQKNISSDLSFSQLLDELAPFINTTEFDLDALKFLDIIVTNLLSFDNYTEMSFLAVLDELEPLLDAANISLDGLEVIRTIIENFGTPSENAEFSLMDLLEELQPYLNGSDIDTEALKVLDLIISQLVPLENITDERIMDLIKELEPYFNISGIDPEWMDAIGDALINMTVSLDNDSLPVILQLLRVLRPFLNDTDINLDGLKLIETIIRSIDSLKTETDPNRLFESLGEFLSLFENATWFQPTLRNMFISDLFTVALHDILTQSTGKVYTFPDDLGSLTSPDDIEEFIPIIYRSVDILQVLFGITLDQEKITQLATSPDIIQMFCPNGSLDFFNTSFAQGVDLVSLQSDLCKVDLNAVINEVTSYPPLAMLLTEVPYFLHESPLPSFNWTAYFIHSEELNKAITDFMLDPLEIKVNQMWLNATKTDLLQVLIDLGESQNQAMLMQQLESLQTFLDLLHEQISPSVTWIREFEDAVKILLGSISYSNDILETLPGQNITFEDILPPYLAEHFRKSFEYSGDINALFLQAAINAEQLIAMSSTGDILSVICTNVSSLETLLDLPPEVNITAAQQIICSLNETAVNVEVMREVQKILDKAQLDKAIDVMKASEVVEEFINNVVELKHSPPNFSQFDEAWMETTTQKWEAILKSLESAQMIPTSLDNLVLEMLFQMLQETLKDDPGFQSWLIQLRMEEYFTVLLIEQAKDLTGKNISFQELNKFLGEFPSLQDILSLREVIPEIVDILLALSTNPEKMEQFWNSSKPFQSVCKAGTFSYFFEVPMNSTTNLTSLESRLCSLNKTALLTEVDSLLGITEIQEEITKILTLDPSLPPLNYTAALFLRDLESQLVFSELFKNPPTIYFDEEFWQNTKMEIQQVLSLWEEDLNKLLMPSNPLSDLTSLIEVIEGQMMQFENETWYQTVLANMRLMDYVNELVTEWATDLQGKILTLPRLDELFQNSPNIKEFLKLTDLTSDIIDAFLSLTLAPEKWTEFWTIENPIATLCVSGEFINFFQLPEDSSSNITAVAKAVCSVNMTAVDIELKKFLNLNEIGAEISQILYNSASLGPYNWTASFILSIRVQQAVQGLVDSPPIISVDPIWWNKTQTDITNVVERWLKRVQETPIISPAVPNVMDIIETLLGELDGFKNESWYQDIVQQMRINDLINKLLISLATELQGKTLTLPTLQELFMNSTNIRALLEVSAVAPDIIDAFLTLSLQPDKWESFWTMKDPIPTLCASGNFTSFFQLLPDSTSDITAVADAICSLNFTAVGKEFSDLIKLDEISSQLAAILYNHPSLGPYNWTASYILSMRTSEAITNLILDPPVIKIDAIWWNQTQMELEVVVAQWTSYLMDMTPGQVDNTSMEWLPEIISSLEEQLFVFRNESWYQDLITQMRVMDLVNKLFIEWVTQFQGQTFTLPTLEELFENSTHVRQLLELTNLTPDLIDVLFSFSVQEEKWAAFLAMDNPIATLCASGNFTTFFQLPPDSPSNVTAVADAVCAVNITAVDRELKYLFKVDSISSQLYLILYNHPSLGPYNWTASYQLSQDVQQAIEDLVVNPPVFLVDPIWLNQTRTDLLVVIQQWWTRLVEMSTTDPTGMDGFAALIAMLESQLSAFQDMEWYQDLITQMRLMDEINRIIAQWINRLSGATITIPHFNELFQNVTYIKELLELQNITPELIDVFLSLSVSPEKWDTFWSMGAPIAELCANGNFSTFFVLPPDSMTDIMVVEEAVCSVNITAIDKELGDLFEFDQTFAKIALILANDPSLGPYNWTASYLLSMQLQEAITEFALYPLIIEVDDVWWNGTRSRLLDVLQQWGQHLGGMLDPSNPTGGIDINSIVEMISTSLTPLFENSEWYQDVIQSQRIMDEVNKIILHWAQELKGQTIILPHLDGLFENATHVREILALQELTPEFIELLMSLSMKPEKFNEFFMMDKPFATLCMNSSFAEFFELPSESKVNISELQRAVCSVNLTAAENELNYLLQLDSIAFKFMQIFYNDPSLGPYNWTASVILSQKVQEAIAQLVTTPPVFKVDSQWLNNTLSALKYAFGLQMTRFGDMFGQPDAQQSLENGLQELEMFLNQSGVWYKVQPVLEAVTLYLDLYITQTEQNVENVKIYLNITIPPDVAADLTSLSSDELKAYIISNFIPVTTLAYLHDNGLWDIVFCNETVFEQSVYILYDKIINATALRILLCETNSTQLFQDLEGYYGFDIIQLQDEVRRIFESPVNGDFDWQELIDLTQELISLFEEIQKLPEFLHGSMNVSEIHGRLMALQRAVLEQNIETAMTLLYELGPIFDLDGLGFSIRDLLDSIKQQMETLEAWMGMMSSMNNTETSVIELLEMIESSLEEFGVWNQVRPMIEITNLLLGGANEWLYPFGLSPSQVFYNASVLNEVLTRQIDDLNPAFMETKAITDFIPLLQLAYIYNNDLWEQTWQCANYSEGFPDLGDSTNVIEMLCTLNETEFFEEVSSLVKVDILELEKQLSSLEYPSPGSNMTTIPLDWEELINNIQLFANAQKEILYLVASMGDAGSNSSSFNLIWQLIENLDVFENPMFGQLLEMLSSSLPNDDPFIRSYVPAITVLAEQINAEFEAIQDHGINITTFFELQIELMDLVQEILSESDLEAFLQAQINVEMLESIHNLEDVADIFCDEDQFNRLLNFPSSSEIDVGVIQRSLCDLIKSGNATIQLGLYHYLRLGTIYQQALKLYTNNYGAGFPQEDVDWEYTLGELEKLANNFMNIQISFEDWLTLLTQFSGDEFSQLPMLGSTEEMLNQIFYQLDVILMNNTVWHQVKGYIAAVTDLAQSINAEFVEVRELGINVTTFFELQTDLMEVIQEILSENELEALLQATINEEMLQNIKNFEDVADIFCDEDLFNLLLSFPSSSEVDVGVIQRSLCDLIKSSNATIQVGLYHYLRLGTIYQQVLRLYTNNYYKGFPSTEVDLMETLIELNLLVANFMSIDVTQVWHILIEVGMHGDWFDGFPMMPITNMTLSPTSVCEMVLPFAVPLLPRIVETVLIKSDLFIQVVNQLYFDLPDHEDEIQSLLNNQTLVGELMWTTFTVYSDAITALQGISRDMGQIYLLRALFLDIIEGNLRDVACSEQDLRNLLNISPVEDVSDLSSLICSVDAIVQTKLVQELLVIIDFKSAATKIRIIDGPAFGDLPPLSCSSLFDNGEEFVGNMLVLLKYPTAFKLELEIPGLEDLIEDISSIVANLTSGDYSSLQPLVDLLDEFLEEGFLGENGTARLVIDELLQLYDSYIDAINKVPGVIPVNSLWWNSSEVANLLLKETRLTADNITLLMEGSINSTVITELTNLTVLNWGELVCDEDVFMRLLILSSDELKSLVYQETCQHPNKEMLFDEISQRFNLFKFIVELSQSALPAPTLIEFLEEILSNIGNFEKLNSTVVEDFLMNVLPLLEDVDNISDLMNIVPLLENLTLALDSFDELFDNLEPVLGGTPEFQQAKALFELLKEKQYVVDVLREFPDLTVEKMLKYPDAVRFFLEEEIGLAPDIVDIIFNARLNPEMLLTGNTIDGLDSICSKETFNKYLDFAQGTNFTVVVDAICGQNFSTIGEVLGLLFSSFNTDGTIDALSSMEIVEVITNMTDSFQNITQSLEDIQQLQDTIPTLLDSVDSLGQIFDEEMLEELARGEISAFTLLEENSDVFCAGGGSSKRRRRRRRQTLGAPSASSGFCQDLYSSLQSGSFGELQWAFVKPILLGKILYTPISPASDQISKKANKPFEDLTEISEVAQSWIRGVTELTNLLESSGLEDIENLLGNAYISQLLETELSIDADSLRTVLQGNLTSISVETLDQITLLAELVVNVTSCLELDRFMGFESEAEMEKYASRLNMDNLYLAGISFMDLEGAKDVPKHVKYALRMDTDKTPSTDILTDIYWRPGLRGDFFTQQQYLQGFVFLQDMIERAVIELHATSDQLSDVYIQQMPYPCYKNDRYLFIASVIFPLLFTIGFLILMAVMTHQLVYEKERGIEELMKVMGLGGGINWFAWFFSNAVLLTVLMVIIAIILRIASIVQNTQMSVLIVFLLCFAFSLIMQSYMVSSFFQKANIASLGALLVYLLLYIPYGFVFTRGGEISLIGSLAVSLASPSAFSFGCLIISRFEHQGIGVSWDMIWENPRDEDHSNLAATCIMMVVDGFIYFIIGWYIRTVFPGKFGVPRPWYFPFQPSYWFRGIRSDTNRNSMQGGEVNEGYQGESATPMTEMGAQVESEPMHAPVGIAIQNLSKVYDIRCPSVENRALDKMTLNFFEGQVTALLGSNGAGKTTVISIITGLFPASGGSVNIYGQQVGFNAGVRGSDLGLCPQHNALYDELTVKEHLKIFGKLKGMSKKALIEQSTLLLDELRLLDMLNVPVHKLSGGMKRKLCVAISLMGNAKTVILDEPTSGVDPHARRAVWDLIIRSKKDRTIVLCTHFMDEADLLGDRIAILDRGQLRCCGSSAFLKSKFTSGVKLTLSKERPSGSSTPQSSKKLAIGEGERAANGNDYQDLPVTAAKEAREEEEQEDRASSSSSSGVSSQRELCDSAKVTQFLTSKVDGITLLKEVGSELVYQLPSTKEEKAKFPQLFRDLDDQLAALHIRNYGVSDTNLEEVFLKVSTHSDSFMESNVDQSGDITEEDPPKWNKNQNGQKDEVIFGGQLANAFQQVRGIFLKRFHITRRDWRGFIWAVLMPVAMLALGTLMTEFSPVPVFPPLQLTPAMFKDPNYVFFSNGETISVSGERFTKAFLNAPGIGTTCMSDADEMDMYPCEFTEAFFPEPISGLTNDEKKAVLEEDLQSPLCVCEDGRSVCDEKTGGVPPPEWITNTSAILQDLSLKTDVTEYLLNTRQRYEQNRYGGVTFVDIKDGDINRTVIKAWYSNLGYHALPTYINVANNVLLRASLPTGSNPAEYGITAYNHPVELAEALPDVSGWSIASVQFGLVLFLMTALAMVPATLSTLMVQENLNGAKRLHFVSGVTPARYWLTNLMWDMLIYILPAVLIIVVLLIFRIEAFISDNNIGTFILLLLVYGFAIFSQYYLLVPIFSDTGTAFVLYFCSNLILFLVTNMPTFLDYLQLASYQRSEALPVLNDIFHIFTPFCISSALLTLLYNQLETDIYASFGVEKITDPLYMVRWNIIAMAIHAVVAMALILLLEYKKKKRVNCDPSSVASRSPYEQEDEDVEEERERVLSGSAVDDVISLKDITKVYSVGRRKITAVDHISFGVPKGECFGLLGVNGAGKTTLFKTITTAIAPSDGRIDLNANSIGYCPQVDAIYDQLTGEEILYCYARLKGIKEEYVKEVVEDITTNMGMRDFSRKVISTYSGGMKRTLSVAVSLLGNPQLVLMDEPTAGMDPVSKQAVWRGIQAAIMDGRSVIVTSHSMEECENLCTRLAIMVNGQFRCLGSPQHVKHRHGEGYTLILHLLSGDKSGDLSSVGNFMDVKFPRSVLKEHHLTMLRYQLSSTGFSLADIYEAVEKERDTLGIEEYSVTQTTLDQVFVNFAKRQTDGHDDDDASSISSLGNINPAFDPETLNVV